MEKSKHGNRQTMFSLSLYIYIYIYVNIPFIKEEGILVYKYGELRMEAEV
jgi:hypothetical protein